MRKYNLSLFIVITCFMMFHLNGCSSNGSKEYEVSFRKIYGDINLIKDKDNVLSLPFIVQNHNSKFEEYISNQITNNLSFNSEKISIEDFSIVKSLSYKNNSYYYLNLKLAPANDFSITDQIEVDRIKIGNNKSHYIGDLVFKRAAFNDKSHLVVESAAAMGLGVGLSDYFATIKNKSLGQITITTIDIGRFEDSNSQAFFEIANETIPNEKIKLKPGEVAEFNVRFDKQLALDYEVFYFSPSIQYINDTSHGTLYLDYFTSGLSISQDEFKSILSK